MKSSAFLGVLGVLIASHAVAAEPAQPAESAAPTPAPSAPGPDAPRVAYTTHVKKPEFNAMSPGSAGFGMFGALAALSAGEKTLTENNIDDPANQISATLARAYARSQNATLVETPIVMSEKQTLAAVADPATARFVVRTVTTNFGYLYFSTDWSHYSVMYGATTTVMDSTTKKVVLQGRCAVKPKKDADSPTHDEMLANGAARLKQMIAAAADECVAQIQAKAPALH